MFRDCDHGQSNRLFSEFHGFLPSLPRSREWTFDITRIYVYGICIRYMYMVYGIWYMVYGIWYMVYGIWYMVYGIWYMVYGIWYMVYGIWYMVYGIWYMVYGIWYMVYGIWYMVYGIWYMVYVYGIWYMVYGIWYMVYGIWYMVCGMWYVVCGMWYVVCGMWYMVYGIWYMVLVYVYVKINEWVASLDKSLIPIETSQEKTAAGLGDMADQCRVWPLRGSFAASLDEPFSVGQKKWVCGGRILFFLVGVLFILQLNSGTSFGPGMPEIYCTLAGWTSYSLPDIYFLVGLKALFIDGFNPQLVRRMYTFRPENDKTLVLSFHQSPLDVKPLWSNSGGWGVTVELAI